MMKLKEYENKIYEYYRKEDDTLFNGPIFRVKEDKLYLGYIHMINDKNMFLKRLPRWILQDIESGLVVSDYEGKEKDFISSDTLPYDRAYPNNGESIAYDDYNNLLKEFNNTLKKYLDDIKNSNRSYLYDYKTFTDNNECLSVKDYLIQNENNIKKDIIKVINSYGDTIMSSLYD